MPACQPLEMPGCYGFHSTRPAPWEAGQWGVERRPPVQGRNELQAHDTTVLQCLAVEVREGLGRSPGPCHTSSASFLGTPQDSGRSPCVMPRRCFRPSVSQLSGDLLDHELPSVERDRVTGALALQLSIDPGLGGDAHNLVAVAHKLACRHGKPRAEFECKERSAAPAPA
jgi:hypothetical protein